MKKALLIAAALAVTTSASAAGKLKIFSWWSGDEGPALEALIKIYKAKYPSVTVDNATVSGGAGTNAKAVLKTRMLGGTPPTASRRTPARNSSAPGSSPTAWKT